MDIVTPQKRSEVMALVRSKGTQPEKLIGGELHKRGFRYRLHRKDLPGTPDFVFPGRRAVIFVNGCFWHSHEGCNAAKLPENNRDYWQAKLLRNAQRDSENQRRLESLGWRVRTVWTCQLRNRHRRESELYAVCAWLKDTGEGGGRNLSRHL